MARNPWTGPGVPIVELELSTDELDLLDRVLHTVRHGADARLIVRAPAAVGVARKVELTRRSLEHREELD